MWSGFGPFTTFCAVEGRAVNLRLVAFAVCGIGYSCLRIELTAEKAAAPPEITDIFTVKHHAAVIVAQPFGEAELGPFRHNLDAEADEP